jgi:DnaJ-class molecular chaperone
MADPYKTLGVSKDAPQDEIRKAYRKLAKENHPDLNPGNAEAEKRFKEISAAYDIVGDEAKRKRFDAGEIDDQGTERPERKYYREYAEADPNFRYSRSSGGGEQDFGDMDDIFADLFRGHRAGAGGGEGLRIPGGDVRYTLPVEFLEAANGASKTVHMPDGKTLDIKIPAGIRQGQILRLKGQGQPGIGGGPPGDALVEVTIGPSAQFTRDGNNIRSVLPITLSEALNGATVRAETIDGAVDVKIPKGANSGTTMRLRGKGVADQKGGTRGDHMLELRVTLPDTADPELAAYVTDWEQKHPYDPRSKGGRT